MVLAAMFTALTFVATLIHIHVPGMQTGYVNLGDALVITSVLLLGPVYGGVAGALGSALTDLLHGYIVYVLPTFVIKYVMSVAAYFIFALLSKSKREYKLFPVVAGGIVAEIIMITGYFLYEGIFIVNFAGAALGVPGNCVQGILGVTLSYLILKLLKKTDVINILK